MTAADGRDRLLALLEESRLREKGQTLFYRALAAEASLADRIAEAERLNELHADEQHHLSRLTARLLELGGRPDALRDVTKPADSELAGWEATARRREEAEIAWYETLLEDGSLDPETEEVVEEIVASERHHRDQLGGKWMPA